MEPHELLKSLPPPDPEGEARVWRRFQRSRKPEPRGVGWLWPMALVAAAAFTLFTTLGPEDPRSIALEATSAAPGEVAWSDEVHLTFEGTGDVQGTSRDLVVAWQQGTLHAEVEPHRGTGLAVVTEEGRVDVVGTVFHVHRDALGMTTWVDRGQVQVTCADGTEVPLGADDGEHLCLPVRPAMLLGRANALRERGATHDEVLDAIHRGLQVADTPVVRGELLALRMEVRAEAGDVDGALADADAYLGDDGPRASDVRRFAGWHALAHLGCERATPYLSALGNAARPEDHILLAECWVEDDPALAEAHLTRAFGPSLDPTWAARARAVQSRLPGGRP